MPYQTASISLSSGITSKTLEPILGTSTSISISASTITGNLLLAPARQPSVPTSEFRHGSVTIELGAEFTTLTKTSTLSATLPYIFTAVNKQQPRSVGAWGGCVPTTTMTYTLCPKGDDGTSPWCRYQPTRSRHPSRAPNSACMPLATVNTYIKNRYHAPMIQTPCSATTTLTETYTRCPESTYCRVKDTYSRTPRTTSSKACSSPTVVSISTRYMNPRPTKIGVDTWVHDDQFRQWQKFLLKSQLRWGSARFDNLYIQNPLKREHVFKWNAP